VPRGGGASAARRLAETRRQTRRRGCPASAMGAPPAGAPTARNMIALGGRSFRPTDTTVADVLSRRRRPGLAGDHAGEDVRGPGGRTAREEQRSRVRGRLMGAIRRGRRPPPTGTPTPAVREAAAASLQRRRTAPR
jgi:hypothetical protein